MAFVVVVFLLVIEDLVVDVVDSSSHHIASILEPVEVVLEILLAQMCPIMVSLFFHLAYEANFLSCAAELVLELGVAHALVHVLLELELFLRCVFGCFATAALENPYDAADEYQPNNVKDQEDKNRPKVVREQAKPFLIK